jgi:hypothetical protein
MAVGAASSYAFFGCAARFVYRHLVAFFLPQPSYKNRYELLNRNRISKSTI